MPHDLFLVMFNQVRTLHHCVSLHEVTTLHFHVYTYVVPGLQNVMGIMD